MSDDFPLSIPYRDAMARFAGHVQIVTTAQGDVLRGVTATACCSVSDAPPTVLACLNKSNEKNRIFTESGNFAINTLASSHAFLADAFSGRGGLTTQERFALAEWDRVDKGAPVLKNALASFDCSLIEAKEIATHWVLIGAVNAVRVGSDDDALLYYGRGYRTLGAEN